MCSPTAKQPISLRLGGPGLTFSTLSTIILFYLANKQHGNRPLSWLKLTYSLLASDIRLSLFSVQLRETNIRDRDKVFRAHGTALYNILSIQLYLYISVYILTINRQTYREYFVICPNYCVITAHFKSGKTIVMWEMPRVYIEEQSSIHIVCLSVAPSVSLSQRSCCLIFKFCMQMISYLLRKLQNIIC